MTEFTWSQTAATNANADATINFQEGQSPGSVNNSARALMAARAKARDDLAGVKPSNVVITTSGTSTAYSVTTNQNLTALTNGFTITFRAHVTSAGTSTFSVDGLTAKPLRYKTAVEMVSGDVLIGQVYSATYFQPTDEWLIRAAPVPPDSINGGKIADDSIDSEHYVDGSIDTAHIADDQVTFAKVQNIATARILGRTTASSGNIEELTVSTDLTLAAGVLGIAAPTDIIHISTQTASASSALSFTGVDAAYSSYLLIIDDLRPATDDVDLYLRVRPTAGAFQSTGYLGLYGGFVTSGAVASGSITAGIPLTAAGFGAGYGVGNDASYGLHGTVHIKASGAGRHGVTGNSTYLSASNGQIVGQPGGFYNTGGALDAVQFLFSSGDITSGTIRFYGIKA